MTEHSDAVEQQRQMLELEKNITNLNTRIRPSQ